MIPTIETICEDLAAGKISVQQAIAWLHQHASGAANELRDYFAAKAMQANLTRLDPEQGYVMASECKYAYEWADAMLKARETS